MYKPNFMSKEVLINKTVRKIKQLPESKIQEISDFIDFLLYKTDEKILTENIQQIISKSRSFDFLNDEEELYDETDLKVRYK